MKRGLKQKLYFFLVMALVFFTGKAALSEPPWGCDEEIYGCVCALVKTATGTGNYIAVLVSEFDSNCNGQCEGSNEDLWVDVYGVPFTQLEILGITLGQYVEIDAHLCMSGYYRACAVDGTSVLPPFEGGKDPVSGDDDGNQGNYGQGRF